MRLAVDELIEGKPVSNPKTKAFGCSIKWSWKSEWTDKVNKDWEDKTVTLNDIDEEGVRNIFINNSGKLRLINLWATWCAPCIIEYPELLKLQRMYGNRDFEFVSISTDRIENREKVMEFLEKENSSIQNFIFNKDEKYELIEIVDPKWEGALPYTLLIEPDGTIIYASQGIVDILSLRKVIVEHPLLGRYY